VIEAPKAAALSPRSRFIVSAAKPMLMRSMKATTSNTNRNHISRRNTLRTTGSEGSVPSRVGADESTVIAADP